MNEINISGTYAYRSLFNDTNIDTAFNDLELGRGTMVVSQTDGTVNGTFDMGGGYTMTLKGSLYPDGTQWYLRMTAYGVQGTLTDKWIYDYLGVIVPIWPDAVAQIPTITGSVIRTVDHGTSKAGVTATFYMVLIA